MTEGAVISIMQCPALFWNTRGN